MGWSGLGIALALVVLVTGCDNGDAERARRNDGQESAPPTSMRAPDPGPSIERQLRSLARDALAIDPRGEIVTPSNDLDSVMDTMFRQDSYTAGRGMIYLRAALTVRYPGLDGLRRARDFLALLKKHGFGTAVGYRVDDIVYGAVQRSTDLRCRALLDHRSAVLICIPNAFVDFVDLDLVEELTTLYADETDSFDIGGWEFFYPHSYDADPPFGALLQTNAESKRVEVRAYADQGDGWELVASARSYSGLFRTIGRKVCRSERRGAFLLFCPGIAT